MQMSAKFPRIPHLPFSPGATPDDVRVPNLRDFLGYPVVLTEKMDGANVCLTSETVYARSHSGPASGRMFDELKAHHAMVRHLIPEGISVFAEWCKAVHSIEYTAENFPRLFIIGVRDDKYDQWMDWEYNFLWAGRLGAAPVPKIRAYQFDTERALQEAVIEAAESSSDWGAPQREGIVVRPTQGVACSLWGTHVAKYVNADFKAGQKLGAGDMLWQPGRIPGLE
jgi:hypothetical protein